MTGDFFGLIVPGFLTDNPLLGYQSDFS